MKKKIVAVALAVALLALGSLGSTLAFLISESDPITNTFELGEITYQLILEKNPPVHHTAEEITDPVITPDSPQKVRAGHVDYTITNDAPFLKDYTFLGWFTEAIGGVLVYGPEAKEIKVGYANPYTETKGDEVSLTLHAHWEPGTVYPITYDANGGSYVDGSTKYQENKIVDTDYIISNNIPINGNFTWTEWNTEPDGTGDTYVSGDTYTKNEPMTLYAIWKWQGEETVEFGEIIFINMALPEDGNAYEKIDQYTHRIKCSTQDGADGIAIPIRGLIPEQAYELQFTVDFSGLRFYDGEGGTDDLHGYIFGTNILKEVEEYHEVKSILRQPGATSTNPEENMMWSTEENVRDTFRIKFIATAETMYWFWETTDIVDKNMLIYNFSNFYIVGIDNPEPRVEFENLFMTFAKAPYGGATNRYNGYNSDQFDPVSGQLNETIKEKGTPNTNSDKNYFHTEEYDFDHLRYRIWGYDGHEHLTIPISGLKVNKTYELTFDHDWSKANTYDSSYFYGCSIVADRDGGLVVTPTDPGSALKDLPIYKNMIGTDPVTKGNTIKFTATAETMYWKWTLGNICDGCEYMSFNWIELNNVEIQEVE